MKISDVGPPSDFFIIFKNATIKCLELRQTEFGCLLSWKRAGEFEIEIEFEIHFYLFESYKRVICNNFLSKRQIFE